MGTLEKLEKAPLQSKKFIAYLISSIGTKALLFWMVSKGESDVTVMSTIVAATCLDIGYIIGQAALDKYVRVASFNVKE